MMGGMRAFVRSPWAVGILILLAISFGVFGFRDPFNGVVGGGFLSAGDRQVHPYDVKRTIDQYVSRVREQQGKNLSQKEIGQQGIPQEAFEELKQNAIILAYADKIGVKASPKAAADIIASAPIFRDGLGNVDPKKVAEVAQEQGLSADKFQQELKDQITTEYLQRAIAGGLIAPKILSTPVITFASEKRIVSVAKPTQESLPTLEPATDAELKAYYETKKASFAQPERRRYAAVTYSPDDFIDKAKIDDAAIKAEYDRRIKEFSTPETREIVEAASADEAAVQTVVDLVKQGKKLEDAVNQAKGVTLSTLSVKPGDIKDKKLSDIVFAMPKDEIVGPLKQDKGYLAVRANAITPGAPTPLEKVAPQIRDELARKAAQKLYDDTYDTFYDLVGGSSPLEQIASQVGAPILLFAPVDSRGVDANGEAVRLFKGGDANPDPNAQTGLLGQQTKTLQAMAKAKVGETSDIIEDTGQRAVLRLEEIIPARTPDLAEVKDRVSSMWTADKTIEAAKALAEQFVAAVKSGKDFDETAKAMKIRVIHPPTPISRMDQNGPDPRLVNAMFTQQQGEIAVAADSRGEPWVVRVEKVDKPTPETADKAVVDRVNSNIQQSVGNDILQGFLRGVQTQVKVRQNAPEVQKFIDGYTKDEAG